MSQNDFTVDNQDFPSTRADINSALQALASTNSGATQPTTVFNYQFWYDTTNDTLEMMDENGSASITLASFDQLNARWEIQTNVIQSVSTAGVALKNQAGTVVATAQDGGDFAVAAGLSVGGAGTVGGTVTVQNTAPSFYLDETDRTASVDRYSQVMQSGGELYIQNEGGVINFSGLSATDLTKSPQLYIGGGVESVIHTGNIADTTNAGIVEKSTSAENTGLVATDVFPDVVGVKEIVDQVNSNGRFTSAAQTIVSGNLLTLAHGLGATPFMVQYVLKCLTAEYNYSVGDEIIVNFNGSGPTQSRISSPRVDATNIYVRFSSNSTVFRAQNNLTGAAETLTNANWELYVKAMV